MRQSCARVPHSHSRFGPRLSASPQKDFNPRPLPYPSPSHLMSPSPTANPEPVTRSAALPLLTSSFSLPFFLLLVPRQRCAEPLPTTAAAARNASLTRLLLHGAALPSLGSRRRLSGSRSAARSLLLALQLISPLVWSCGLTCPRRLTPDFANWAGIQSVVRQMG